ncbi:biogenesis of lysosome-related organelles complex 1 subunit 2-like [Phascolarctos cinereus]|uniref:Biogenesis of lysosome-related organelles complex 1 subunit 2-like n=1 Tax=Phascolarctos cinereus TaxID=38626 RepID=A0A6P5JKP3_PHACI|nr:biogenesis of lysosome-related organelles complex 1 subunit 2-like [Phascolarctos cinereus]
MYAESLDNAVVDTTKEDTEPADADIMGLCQDVFSKMATYLTSELTATIEDYKLLKNMNKLTSLKYLEMKEIAVNISRNLKDINQTYKAFQPYLDQITLIQEQVAALEQAAYQLNVYSKKLEAKYKKLERR